MGANEKSEASGVVQLDKFIASLSDDLDPLRELAVRLRSTGCKTEDDGFALSPQPQIASEAYALRLYLPLTEAILIQYQQIHRVSLSSHYWPVLKYVNGIHAFEFSLFGTPRSMAKDPPLLDRSTVQPYDLATANKFWKRAYSVPDDWFHFGGGPFSFDEKIGYFFNTFGTIYSSRKNGDQLGTWTSFSEFLKIELNRAEAAYPAHEAFMANLTRKHESVKPRGKKPFRH